MTGGAPKVITVWGHSEPPLRAPGIILWSAFGAKDEVSLPAVIHAHRPRWKGEYGRWLRSVGTTYSTTTAAARFARKHDGLSYWWMTFPTEFTFTHGSLAYDVMRVMALIDMLSAQRPERVNLEGLPTDVAMCIEQWCRTAGMEVFPSPVVESSTGEFTQPSHGFLAGLKHIMAEYARYRGSSSVAHHGDLLVVDYFDNLLPASLVGEKYDSKYWGPLVGMLQAGGPEVNWAHLDVRSSEVPSAREARRTVQGLDSLGGTAHGLVQDAMGPALAARSLSTLRSIMRLGHDAWPETDFVDHQRELDCRPLAAKSWDAHHCGVGAAANALWIHYMACLARVADSRCLYLMENQPWEMALLHFWRRYQHKPIHGFAHSVVRDWDLRYALPLAGPMGAPDLQAPAPDTVLTGSQHEARILAEDGYPEVAVVEVEAVRFLQEPQPAFHSSTIHERPRLLVLGEYDEGSNLALIEMVSHVGDVDADIVYRPHPSQPESVHNLPQWMSISDETTLAEALESSQAVIAMSTSTSIIGAASAGLPILLVRDGSMLDGCPIDASAASGVAYIGSTITPAAVESLMRAGSSKKDTSTQHLNSALPLWQSWLEHALTG